MPSGAKEKALIESLLRHHEYLCLYPLHLHTYSVIPKLEKKRQKQKDIWSFLASQASQITELRFTEILSEIKLGNNLVYTHMHVPPSPTHTGVHICTKQQETLA